MKSGTIIILISLFLSGKIGAQSISETERFADSLFEVGSYKEAAFVYKRVIFFAGQNTDTYTLVSKLSVCLLETQNYNEALKNLDKAFFLADNSNQRAEISFTKVKVFVQQHKWNEVISEMLSLEVEENDLELKKRVSYYLGIAHFGLLEFDEAEDYFMECVINSPEAQEMLKDIFANEERFLKPNPRTAKILSAILPGLGQIYAGDISAGINSIGLTSGLVVAGVFIAKAYSPLDAMVAVFPWIMRYYMGGYTKAEGIARRKRQENMQDAFSDIQQIIISAKSQ